MLIAVMILKYIFVIAVGSAALLILRSLVSLAREKAAPATAKE